MEVVYRAGQVERELVIGPTGSDTTVHDLAVALGMRDPNAGLTVDGRPVGARLPLGDAGVHEGAILAPGDEGGAPAPAGTPTGFTIAIVAGQASGARCEVAGDGTLVGRDSDCDLVIRAPTVSRQHFRLRPSRAGGLELEVLSQRAATLVNGSAVSGVVPVRPGDIITAGGVALLLEAEAVDDRPRGLDLVRGIRADGAVAFNRPPRSVTVDRDDPIAVPQPPVVAQQAPFNLFAMLTPLATSAVTVIIFKNLAYLALGALTPLMAIANLVEQRSRGRRGLRREGRRFQSALDDFERAVAVRRDEVAARRRHQHCDPAEALRRATTPSSKLWERRPQHADFLQLSAGLGSVPWRPPLGQAPAPLPAQVADVLASHALLANAPVDIDLGSNGVVGVVGERVAALAVARGLLCQLAVLHGPADARVVVLTSADRAADWDWTKWLPHIRSNSVPGIGTLTSADPGRSALILRELAKGTAGDDAAEPTTVVVLDDETLIEGRNAPARHLLRGGAGRVAGIVVASAEDQLPAMCTSVIVASAVGPVTVRYPQRGVEVASVLAAGMGEGEARRCARALARFDDPEVREAGAGLPDLVPLLPLLGTDLDPEAILQGWRGRARDAGLAAPIGMAEDGPFVLDMVEQGPHGLVGGTTGSGKSELLRTIVAAFALTHDAAHVNFVLVDYKGGATFAECAQLPHTVGVVTDLDPQLAERALRCLKAELQHRERLLDAAGVRDLPAYIAAGSPAGPMPRIMVIVDEFASMVRELPDFIDSLVGIAMLGRTLGVHLVLATQRPAGVVSDTIRAQVRLRVALRFEDAQDSQDVIDSPDATLIARQGRAFVRLGPRRVVPVQTALVSGRRATADATQAVTVTDFTFARSAAPAPRPRGDSRMPTDLVELAAAVLEAHRRTGMSPPRRPWPDPLPAQVTLDGLAAVGKPAVVGGAEGIRFLLVDDPDAQDQYAGAWYPSLGNLLLFGNVGSGTTTALASLACAASGSSGADATHLYVIDFGAGELAPLAALPHTGAYIRAQERERQVRLIRHLRTELDNRKASDSDTRTPRVIVLLDNYAGFAAQFDDIDGMEVMRDFARLYEDGPGAGISWAVTADRPGAVAVSMGAITAQKLLLRLADPADFNAFGVSHQEVPTFVPGRGVLTETRRVVQVAQPAPSLAEQTAAIAASTPASDRGPRPIGSLPPTVSISALAGATRVDEAPWFLALGLGDSDLAPAGLTLYGGEHAIVAGPPRSGRSTALCTIRYLVRERDPSLGVVSVALRPSPLRQHPAEGEVLITTQAALAELLAAPRQADRRLLLVDDADLLDDETGRRLISLIATAGEDEHLVLTGRPDSLRAFSHWTAPIRKSKCGLLLRPTLELDGDLFGISLPMRRRPPVRPGCGYLVQGGQLDVVQVATGD